MAKAPKPKAKSNAAPQRKRRIRRKLGELSFCAALQAGEKWTPAFHQQWCDDNGKDATKPIEVRAELIRALLFVEGAHMSGCEPPAIEAEKLDQYSLDPKRRHLAQALVIDWTTELAEVKREEVEQALEAAGEFEGLEDGRDEQAEKSERERRIRAEGTWQRYHNTENRPQIVGDLDFTGGRFPGGLVLRGCVWVRNDRGEINSDFVADRSEIGGTDLTGSVMGTLRGDRLRIHDNLQAWRLKCLKADLRGACIEGGLYFQGARFEGNSGSAFICDSAEIGGSVHMRDGFHAKAEVNLVRARIEGQLAFTGARLEPLEGRSLVCNAAAIGATVFLDQGFIARSEVNFVRANIGSQLACRNGRFEGENGKALHCDAAVIGADVFLDQCFLARATVSFTRARIGGNLILHEGRLVDRVNAENIILRLRDAHISATLSFARSSSKPGKPIQFEGSIDLTGTRCAVLEDTEIKSDQTDTQAWLTEAASLTLDGFTYARLGSRAPKNWNARKAWLDRQPAADRAGKEFKPQPFEQLAKVLREMGHTSEARSTGLSKQWRVHRSGSLSPLSSLFRWLLLWPTGYGYRPGIAAGIALAMMLFALPITGTAYRLGYMTPAQPHAALAAISAELGTTPPDVEDCLLADATETVPPFNAGAYVIDAFIPLVDIDQESSWKPARAPRCDGRYTALAPLDEINPGLFKTSYELNWWERRVSDLAQAGGLHWLQWLLMISGFAISALIAASLSGLIRRD